jgi:hypothetical protein
VSKSALRGVQRRGLAIAIYRGILNLGLLVAAFNAFPDKQVVVAFAVLVFSQGIAAIGATVNAIFVTQNHLDDMAERKTRHAILLATSDERSEFHFWSEVDRRVAEEGGEEPQASPWWAQTGMVAGTVFMMLAGDLFTIFLALLITGG